MRMSRGAARALTVAGIVAALGTGALVLTGCPDRDGPAEKLGEKMDDVAEKIEDAVDPKGPAEKLGEKIDDALDD